MTYQQIIATPCTAMGTLTYDAYCALLNASYRQFIILEAEQMEEGRATYYADRSRKIRQLEKHINALHLHVHYRRFFADMNTQIAAA